MKKTTTSNLSAFSKKTAAAEREAAPLAAERERGKHETVMLTIRVPREAWKRLHGLALNDGATLRSLTIHGLNLVFAEKGLPELIEE